jgi:hypothetical protein
VYVPAEERGGLKLKVFEPAEKVTHAGGGVDIRDIEQLSDSGSIMVGRA